MHGQGSTFNGIMPTNGYQPLWMLVCVLGARITSASAPLVQLIMVVQDLLILGSISLLVMISRAEGKQGAALGCAPLLFFGMVVGIWRLLEANVAFMLQIGVLILVVPVFPHPPAQAWTMA